MSEDIELNWSYLSNLMRNTFEHFIPTITVRDNNQPLWSNPDIWHHIKCLRTFRRKYNNHPTEHNLANLEQSQQQLQLKISAAKSDYEHNLVSEFANNNNSKIYKYIRNLTNSASIPSTMFHDSSPVTCDNNIFNNYFYSIFIKTTSNPSSVIIIPHHCPILSSLKKMSIML